MLLNLTRDFGKIRFDAKARIDEGAEAARGRYITLGAGQAMVYAQKEKEAEVVAADPDIDPQQVPHVAAEAAQYQITLLDAAAVILTMAHLWRMLSPSIEVARLASKDQIDAAATQSAINQIVAATLAQFDGM
jgi:hypothetical protein